MLKKALFVLVLALQAATIGSVAYGDNPLPACWPCPGDVAAR